MRLRTMVLAGAAALAFHGTSHAIENITSGELALTPPFCQDVQTINGWSYSQPSPRAAHWVEVMGPTFWAMHHYCWALIGLHRAQFAEVSPMTRKFLIKNAIDDYGFVITNSTPDFVLLPEVFTRMGDAQLLLGDTGAAYESFARARAIKPDYWPPYLRWADVLVKSNKKAEARELIAEGLSYSPDAQPLREKYIALGGNPRNVRPINKGDAASSPVSRQAASNPATASDARP